MRTLRSTLALVALLSAFAATGCEEIPSSPTMSAPFSQTDLQVGTGDVVATGQTLGVNYSGWLYDATKPDFKGLPFDSNLGRPAFEFVLGNSGVIQGWDQGVVGMRVGGIRRLVIPPTLAYGNLRSGIIPPYSTLVFDIEVLTATTP